MKKTLFFLSIFLTINCSAQEKKCSDFRTGEFRYVEKDMRQTIVRNDTLQIEIDPVDKIEIHTSIEWTSECEYIMTYKKIINWPEDVSDVIGKKIYVTILETKENWYKAHAKGVYSDGEIEFIKVN